MAEPTEATCGANALTAATKGCTFLSGATLLRVQQSGAAAVEGTSVLEGVPHSEIKDDSAKQDAITGAIRKELAAKSVSAKFSAKGSRGRRLSADDGATVVDWNAEFTTPEDAALALETSNDSFESGVIVCGRVGL